MGSKMGLLVKNGEIDTNVKEGNSSFEDRAHSGTKLKQKKLTGGYLEEVKVKGKVKGAITKGNGGKIFGGKFDLGTKGIRKFLGTSRTELGSEDEEASTVFQKQLKRVGNH